MNASEIEESKTAKSNLTDHHQPLAGRNNMEEPSVELNESSTVQSGDSSIDKRSADGSVSTIVEITEGKYSETLSYSIPTNASEIEESKTAKSNLTEHHQPLAGRNNMEEPSVELNESSTMQSGDSSIHRRSADGSVSTIVEITEGKDAETLSCSIPTNASEIEEKSTAKSNRFDSITVQLIEENDNGIDGSSLATNEPKIDEKETVFASCSSAKNPPVIKEICSANSTPVPEFGATDNSGVNSREESRIYEAAEKVVESAKTALEEAAKVAYACESVILRAQDADIAALETLKRAKFRVQKHDGDLEFQYKNVARKFKDARWSTYLESAFVESAKESVERAGTDIARKMNYLLQARNDKLRIAERTRALERSVDLANQVISATRNSRRRTLIEMKKCYADIDEDYFLDDLFVNENRDPRSEGYLRFYKKVSCFTAFYFTSAVALFTAGCVLVGWTVVEKSEVVLKSLIAFLLFLGAFAIFIHYYVDKKDQRKARKERRQAIQEIDEELAELQDADGDQ